MASLAADESAGAVLTESYDKDGYCNVEMCNIYSGAADDVLCDCIIITDDHIGYRLNSRLIEHRCPALIPAMHYDEATQQYTIYTAVTIDIIKNIFHAIKYDDIDVDNWLQLERILKVANSWKLKDVERCVTRKFFAGMNKENCIAVWRMCAKYLPEQVKKMDVWILLKRWISADRKKRIPLYRNLLKSIRYNLLNDEQKAELKKDLLRLKIDITDEKTVQWSPINTPRIHRDLLIAIGGWEKTGPTNIVEVLDVNNNTWRRVGSFEDQRKVAYHECIVIDKKLYIIGGFEGSQYFNTVRCYDGNTKTWSELAPMHHARCYISACEINGTIIVAGGSDGRSRLRAAEIYDTQKNQWTKIRSMVQRRSDAAACAMGGKMYIAGGYTGETVLQTVEMYTPETDIWTEVAHMSTPRSGLACAADVDFMLIAGGFDGANRLNSAEILRIGSAHTANIEPMPVARSNFAMCKMGKYFYAIGGYNTSVTKSAVRFDGKKWEHISDISVPRSALRVVLLKAWPDPAHLLRSTSLCSKNIQSPGKKYPKCQKGKKYESAAATYDLD